MKSLLSALRCTVALLTISLAHTPIASAQEQTPQQQQPPAESEPAPPRGTVILHRSTDQPDQPSNSESSSSSSNPNIGPHPTELVLPTDAERSSLTFTSWDLNIHLTPATSHLEANAIFTIKNTGATPLSHIGLQLSSTLHWEAISLRAPNRVQPLPYAQHIIDTAADHTGQAAEAVINLPEPLTPGATLNLTAFYAGEITTSTQRLERIGASPNDAAYADWDTISPAFTGLRGFGNVLWYPTAAAPISLSNTGQQPGSPASSLAGVGLSPPGLLRLRQAAATIRLRVSVHYSGEPPAAAYFCGQRQFFNPVPEDPSVPVTESSGIAIAEFPAQTLGFRSPSLFVVPRNTVTTDNMLIAAVTPHPGVLPSYNAGSQLVRPLLSDWLSPNPLEPLTLIDHEGQPFEDRALLVVPMQANDAGALAPALAHSLTHAWFRSGLTWLNEGVPQFLSLLWIEQNQGRDAALSMLHSQVNTLALAEPQVPHGDVIPTGGGAVAGVEGPASPAGQPLIQAHDEAFYGTKSAAVLWMLRSLAGDAALKRTLIAYRDTVARDSKQETPQLLQHLLEKNCHRDLAWFFNDWVYRDRGLPDFSIVRVTPRDLSTGGKTTWLVAAEVRNDGYAAADVPITVRSGNLTKTEYLHLPGRTTASTRIIFEGIPAEVIVNDGAIPEPTAATHIQHVTLPNPAP